MLVVNHGYKKVPEYVVKYKPKTDEEIKAKHRKRLLELSVKLLGEVPQLEEPSEEQRQFLKHKRFHK